MDLGGGSLGPLSQGVFPADSGPRRGGGGVGSALFRGGDSVLGVFYMVHFKRNNDNLEILGHGI